MTAVLERPAPGQMTYTPQGRVRELWDCRDEAEVMVSGPAGTGKSRAILEYLYMICCLHPGIRVLIARATRASLTESGLVTFEQHVVPKGHGWVRNQIRRVRQSYELPNGSEIVVGGLDNTARIMSTEFDVVYVQEAREIEESSWEDLTSRLRNGKLPWQQIIGDTNPDGPTHWIKMREAAGRLRMIESRHEDNPVLWDARADATTPAGEVYLARLDNLTGVRHKRLRLGLWVGAENMVYDLWDPAVHYIDPFPIPAEWQRFRACDFGYTHPFACLWGAVDEDGRLYIYRQMLKTQTLVRDHAHAIHDWTGSEKIAMTITDHDLEGRDDLDTHLGHSAKDCKSAGVAGARQWTTAAVKDVQPGIERVSQRLKIAGDGSPRLFVFKNSLVDRDPLLVEAKAPASLEEEFPRYVWRKARTQSAGEVMLEEPVKLMDDALDACFVSGTLIETARGLVPIQSVTTSDYVLTRSGYRRVLDSGMTRNSAQVMTVSLSHGVTITATPDHRIFVNGSWERLDTLRYNDIITVCEVKPSSTEGSYFEDIRTHQNGTSVRITGQVGLIVKKGNNILDSSRYSEIGSVVVAPNGEIR